MTIIRKHANGRENALDRIEAAKDRIMALRSEGVSWRDIAVIVGVGYTNLRKKMDPDYVPRTVSIREQIRQQHTETVNAMRAEGKTWKDIAEFLGVGIGNLRFAMDPEFVERANANRRERRKHTIRENHKQFKAVKPMNFRIEDPRDVRGEWPPPDTRDLTARICGDPLPGRSFLDRMKAQKEGAGTR
jgi:hypothetical protein